MDALSEIDTVFVWSRCFACSRRSVSWDQRERRDKREEWRVEKKGEGFLRQPTERLKQATHFLENDMHFTKVTKDD